MEAAAEPTPTEGTPSRLGPSYFKLFGASTISNLGDGIGAIAYPWLASALTRNGLLIALVAVVQRLPWLLFSLPAGVITDRYDRRTLMVWANIARTVLTLAVAVFVMLESTSLPGPSELDDADLVIDTNVPLYLAVLLATLLLGSAEVLYDNTAQTFMPSIVDASNLEKANGRLWSAEQVANTFGGPILGALLLAVTFSLPFYVDAATFAVSAALIALIPAVRREPATEEDTRPWQEELKEGVRWLWDHDLLRPLAIILGLLNMLGMVSGATLVLFAQEVLDTSPTEFALLGTGPALGGILGGWTASAVSKKLGPGPSLWVTLVGGGVTSIVIGLVDLWQVVWVMFAAFMFVAVLWNVITVSLRQTIIPDVLLGRVNSVYRFFAWGMMPIGAFVGGVIIAATEPVVGREWALRLPWLISGGAQIALLGFAAPKLTTAKIESAREAALAE